MFYRSCFFYFLCHPELSPCHSELDSGSRNRFPPTPARSFLAEARRAGMTRRDDETGYS